jgi:hypothetical protein
MGSFVVGSLPPIDEVAVVDLSGLSVHARGFVSQASAAPSFAVSGGVAQRIAALWRSLPAGEQARCHIPPFGLRFYSAGRVVCQASICWQCNNIYGEMQGEAFSYEFDATSDAGRALLLMLEEIVGHPAAEEP